MLNKSGLLAIVGYKSSSLEKQALGGEKMQKVKEDVWIPTQCLRCYGACAIWVHRVNGVAVEIQGEPDSTMGSGGGPWGKGFFGSQQP